MKSNFILIEYLNMNKNKYVITNCNNYKVLNYF